MQKRKEISAQDVDNTRMHTKLFKQDKLRIGVLLDNLSQSHDNLGDLCKPLDALTDDIMDNVVDCTADMFSECMNGEE